MLLSRVTLIARQADAMTGLSAAIISDLILNAARPADRVEHLAVELAQGRIEIGIYAIPEVPGTGAQDARELVERSIAMAPPLRRWRVAGAENTPDGK